jgi:hypothetical protein
MITVHGPGFRHPAGMTVKVVGFMTKAGNGNTLPMLGFNY